MTLLKTAFKLTSPGGVDGKLTTFIFHRVSPQPDPMFPDEPDARRFGEVLVGVAVLQSLAIFSALRVGKTA